MTAIATIYDAIITKVSGQLTTFQRIPNPYALNENTALLIRKGYGLSIGAGTNTQRYVGCLITWQREFTIGLITQVVNTENDITGRASVEKDLIDSHRLILRSFESDPTMSGVCIKAIIQSDNGIDYIEAERSKYLALEISLLVEYQETSS